MTKTSIALADDHVLFAESLAKLIFSNPAYVHSFSVFSGEELKDQLREKRPDLLILDINLPPFNGLQLIPSVREASPQTKILMLSMHHPADFNLTMEEFAGDGYLLKTSGKDLLLQAIEEITSAQTPFFSTDVQWAKDAVPHEDHDVVFTRREKQIIRLISEGKTSKEIAENLSISEHTVKTHRTRIREKMNVSGVAELLNRLNHQ